MSHTNCYCSSDTPFSECCEPYISGTQKAPTPEALMRSRYSAYATKSVNYLIATTHISKRKDYSISDISDWAAGNRWLKLEIIKAHENAVEFKAYYSETKSKDQEPQVHHEDSTFVFEDCSWFYLNGKFY